MIFLMAVADSDENELVSLITTTFVKANTNTGETLIRKLWEGLLERDDRYEGISAGETLQGTINSFFNDNNEFPLLRIGAGEEDNENGKL